jgi:hypothetical protein
MMRVERVLLVVRRDVYHALTLTLPHPLHHPPTPFHCSYVYELVGEDVVVSKSEFTKGA